MRKSRALDLNYSKRFLRFNSAIHSTENCKNLDATPRPLDPFRVSTAKHWRHTRFLFLRISMQRNFVDQAKMHREIVPKVRDAVTQKSANVQSEIEALFLGVKKGHACDKQLIGGHNIYWLTNIAKSCNFFPQDIFASVRRENARLQTMGCPQ